MSFSSRESILERRINPSPAYLQKLEARWEESQQTNDSGED